MALTKVNNDLQDALAAAQPTITSVGTLTGLTVGGNTTIQKDDALLFIKETDGTNIAAVGDHTGAGQGCVFLYNHGGTATTQLKADSASTIGHGLTVDGTTNTTLSIEGDTSAGSTFINFADGTATTKAQISGAKAGASGGRLTFSTNNSSGTLTEAMRIDQVGRVTMPSQPAFLIRAAGLNNLPLGYSTLTFDNEKFDVGANFASNTFTAPVTGKYQLSFIAMFTAIDNNAAFIDFLLTTSNNVFENAQDFGVHTGTAVYSSFGISILADMDAGDTAICQYYQSGGNATADFSGASYFSGYLAC
jgi:hypothetical protein